MKRMLYDKVMIPCFLTIFLIITPGYIQTDFFFFFYKSISADLSLSDSAPKFDVPDTE